MARWIARSTPRTLLALCFPRCLPARCLLRLLLVALGFRIPVTVHEAGTGCGAHPTNSTNPAGSALIQDALEQTGR
ncbi:hypothetical protein C8Q78DRAFT_1056204 [Trametes maxima]|nr:hypothetical protein C8Q78DRAFT_1056204 [Trametes maxima]